MIPARFSILSVLAVALAVSCGRPCPVSDYVQGTVAEDYAAQRDCFAEIADDVNRAGGVFYMYDHDVPDFTPAPRGYKPVYISHYGRHGARYFEGKSVDNTCRLFKEAHSKGILTEKGEECYGKLKKVGKLMYRHNGDLTPDGAAQQKVIAHNMYRNYKRVFRRDARIDAVSSTSIRSILTMSSFCAQMCSENPSLQVSMASGKSNMNYTNPFTTLNPDVEPTDEGFFNKNACWKDTYYGFMQEQLTPEKVFGPLFTDLSILGDHSNATRFEADFFETVQWLQCKSDIDFSLWEYFPQDELFENYEVNNSLFFLTKGPDTLCQKGRQYAFVWTVLQDIIDKADSDLESGDYAARLRFGHDIIPMAMLCLLDVPGFNRGVDNLEDIKDVFHNYDFPMSLNLQFIFYRDRSDDTLVRVMYNERDLALPVGDCGTPYYYRWEDFRAYALSRIDLAHAIISSTQAPPELV